MGFGTIVRLLLCLILTACLGHSFNRDKTVARFENNRFHNLEPTKGKSFWDVMEWQFGSFLNSPAWPEYTEKKQFKVESTRSKPLKVVVINHATVLIQMDHMNILTDPHFTIRASPVSFAGPARVVPPGVAFADLPPIDAVVISHNHYDHLDLPTLKMLEEKFSPTIFAGLGTKDFLEGEGMKKVVDMDWWESSMFKNIRITFTPAQHWSKRGLFDRNKMLWGSFFIKGGQSVYFAGDTGYGKFFKMIEQKLSAPDVSLLPIGAYEPRDFMLAHHMNPDDAVRAFQDLKTKQAYGMHFGTFKLTNEAIDDPPKDLAKALEKYKISKDRFIAPEFGRTYSQSIE